MQNRKLFKNLKIIGILIMLFLSACNIKTTANEKKVIANNETGTDIVNPSSQGFYIKTSESIICKAQDSVVVKNDYKIQENQSIICEAKNFYNFDTTPSAWGIWLESTAENNSGLHLFENSAQKIFTYKVNKDHAVNNVIELTYLLKNSTASTQTFLQGVIKKNDPATNAELEGLSLEQGIPQDFFVYSSAKTPDRMYKFIEELKQTEANTNLEWSNYTIAKLSIAAEQSAELKLQTKENNSAQIQDLQILYKGVGITYDPNNSFAPTPYEYFSIKKYASSGSENDNTTQTNYYTFQAKNANTWQVTATAEEFFDHVPNSVLYILQGNKLYLVGIEGLSKDGAAAEQRLEQAKQKIADLFTTDEHLQAAYALKNSNAEQDIIKKAKAAHDYLIYSIKYGHSPYCRFLYGAIVEEKAVCEGIARAFKAFMDELGVENKVIIGPAAEDNKGILHAWNAIKIGAHWYYVDVTWDNFTDQELQAYGENKSWIRHRFFLKSYDYMHNQHHFSSPGSDDNDKKYDSDNFTKQQRFNYDKNQK